MMPRHVTTQSTGQAAPEDRVRRGGRFRLGLVSAVTAVLVGTIGILVATPAQASTAACNSERLCFTQPDSNVTNVDFADVPLCGPTTYPGPTGNLYIRNRSSIWWVDLYYDYNGDGSVTASERVATLVPEQQVKLKPDSRYFYCKF
ncbi:hypothetical protein ACLMNJ_34040 [Streptomyces seoulensis]